jgi:hypothetical protein
MKEESESGTKSTKRRMKKGEMEMRQKVGMKKKRAKEKYIMYRVWRIIYYRIPFVVVL